MKISLPKSSDQVQQWGPVDMKLLYNSFWFAPMSGAVKSRWGIYWTEMVGIMENDTGTFFWWKNSLENEGVKSIKRWLLPDDKRKLVTDGYWELIGEIKKTAGKLERLKPKASFADVQSLALKWHALYYKFWSLADVFEIANYGAPEYLKKQLSSFVPKSELESVMEVLLAPENLSFNQLSEKELLECVLKANPKIHLESLIKNYAAKWHWLDNSYYQSKRLPPAYFLKKIKELSRAEAKAKLSQIKKYLQSVKQKKTAIIKNFKLSVSIAKLAEILSFSIWMQDHRKGIAWWSSDVATQFSKHLAKRLGVPLEDILHYSADEWREAFAIGKKLSDKVFNQRKNKLYVMYSRKGFYTFLAGTEAKRIAKHFASLKHENGNQQTDSLSGTVVSKGSTIIKGVVRVIHSARQSNRLKRGEILVAPMTSPDYISAMRLAKAVITDVGGLMSHAAIVSRELGIPCIVNTKIATKILKNGDRVTINTKSGTVIKL